MNITHFILVETSYICNILIGTCSVFAIERALYGVTCNIRIGTCSVFTPERYAVALSILVGTCYICILERYKMCHVVSLSNIKVMEMKTSCINSTLVGICSIFTVERALCGAACNILVRCRTCYMFTPSVKWCSMLYTRRHMFYIYTRYVIRCCMQYPCPMSEPVICLH